MAKKTIEQVDVASKRVLMRVDFNVPLDKNGAITDDRRIRLALPSIRSVIERGGRLILMSHLGRPQGKGYEAGFSLKPAAASLEQLLGGVSLRFVEGDCAGSSASEAVAQLDTGQVLVLDNLRFHPGEKAGDGKFGQALGAYGDVYCHEAFGTAHRSDASLVAVPRAMGDRPKVAGLLLEKELRFLSEAINAAGHPFVAVLGGAKISDKLAAIHNLMGKVDTILIGGAMAYTFLKALGHEMGSSMVQLGMLNKAQAIIDEAAASSTDLILPQDHVCGRQITHMTPVKVTATSIPAGWMGLDIGPETMGQFVPKLHEAKTIVWNGPVGVFETPPFDVGTKQVAQAVARATSEGAVSILGGGDTAAAVVKLSLADRFTHVSTGGGASLQMLEGRRFGSVELLDDAQPNH
ncbi:MAG: phosphoglycerate kinase [Planctomycetes bacterium]|nr:phosphoglycerate kinase [Planctomycetota bacterium]